MDTEAMKNELLNDFKKLIAKIDFNKYNPTSELFINAVNTGMMVFLLSMSYEESISKDTIRDEILSAEAYFSKYKESGDAMYKQMALDEVHHADYLLKQRAMKPIDESDRTKLSTYDSWLKSLVAKLK